MMIEKLSAIRKLRGNRKEPQRFSLHIDTVVQEEHKGSRKTWHVALIAKPIIIRSLHLLLEIKIDSETARLLI